MDEEFKRQKSLAHSNNFLLAPEPLFAGSGQKDRNAKSHIEFMSMMESNRDPLNRQGQPLQNFTIEDLRLHNTAKDAWIAINGKVYDMTMYVDYHPGGKIIMNAAGTDGTHLFNRYHPWVNIEALIGKLHIGNLVTYIG